MTIHNHQPFACAVPSQQHAAPWCVEAVWLDGSIEDAPLHISASLPVPKLGHQSNTARVARIKLSDGTVYSADLSTLEDGESHEIASAGDSALRVQLSRAVAKTLSTAQESLPTSPARDLPRKLSRSVGAVLPHTWEDLVPTALWSAAMLLLGAASALVAAPLVENLALMPAAVSLLCALAAGLTALAYLFPSSPFATHPPASETGGQAESSAQPNPAEKGDGEGKGRGGGDEGSDPWRTLMLWAVRTVPRSADEESRESHRRPSIATLRTASQAVMRLRQPSMAMSRVKSVKLDDAVPQV